MYILGMVFFLNHAFFCQKPVQDAMLWTSVYLEKPFDNGFIPHVKVQNRMNENMLRNDVFYVDAGLSYEFKKLDLLITADYVFTRKHNLDPSYQTRHQYYLAAFKKLKYRYWSFTYRLILQGQLKEVHSSDKGLVPTYTHRHKFTLQRKLSRTYNVYLADELFYNLFNYRGDNYLQRNRTFLGLEWNVNRRTQIDFYFCLQQQFNQSEPLKRDFIYGITYNHSFK